MLPPGILTSPPIPLAKPPWACRNVGALTSVSRKLARQRLELQPSRSIVVRIEMEKPCRLVTYQLRPRTFFFKPSHHLRSISFHCPPSSAVSVHQKPMYRVPTETSICTAHRDLLKGKAASDHDPRGVISHSPPPAHNDTSRERHGLDASRRRPDMTCDVAKDTAKVGGQRCSFPSLPPPYHPG